jgi:sarcosine reductase
VLTAGELLTDDEGMKVREAIVDMSGPGAAYTPFGSTFNVVLQIELAPGVSLEEGEETFRLAGLRAAVHLAEATRDQQPGAVQTYETAPPSRPLPKVAHIRQLMTVGTTQNAWTYGFSMLRSLPTVLHPNELLDGAVVNANFHFATIRTPTYMHQNDPVSRELYGRHGQDLDFAGVVLAPGYDLGADKKERTASFAAKLALMLGAEGVIITAEGGGHGGVDVMMLCQQSAHLGMKPVVVMNEMADVNGADPGLVYAVPEADAIVSTGNREELIELPRMPTVFGGSVLLDSDEAAAGPLHLPIRQLYTSTSQVGGMRLAAASY